MKINGSKIRELRKEMWLTQTELAQKIGVNSTIPIRWEKLSYKDVIQRKGWYEKNMQKIVDLYNEWYTRWNFTVKPIKKIKITDIINYND